MSSVVSQSTAQPASRPQVVVAAGTTPRAALEAAGVELTGPSGAVVVRDSAGQLRDLDVPFGAADEVEPVPLASPDGLAVLRHSTAHVLAQAVQELFPNTLLGIGPPIQDGFYYDFLPSRPFTPEDLAALEKKMAEIIKAGQRFARREISDDDARTELAHEKFKLELIGLKGGSDNHTPTELDAEEASQVGGGALTMYDNLTGAGELAWTDLCRGPHLPTTRRIPAFKLMRSAAAYWRGDQNNEQLQRIYGTAWATRDELKAYLNRLEEAAKRDHRKLGAELDLFSFPDEIGSGLAVFHPKGAVLRREMEAYIGQRHLDEGFSYVYTPHISKDGLFHTSGHLPYYADGMFPPMEMDNAEYRLKAMNCPMHNLIFQSKGRSYRELPLRLFEFGTVYRYEKSGVVHGLTRVRGLTQDDSHSYCAPEQAPAEIRHLLNFCLGLFRDFGLDDFYLELSTRDPRSDKFIGTDEEWQTATAILEQVALESGLELVPDPGGAAYYGPKISVQARDAIGRTWQLSTIQYDFNQPARFGLEYTGADGERHQPVMIHSAKFGSIERFIGVLTEHYAGAFPAWLAPVQVIGIPVTEQQVDYLDDVAGRLRARGIRVEVDASADRMQRKIRSAQQAKVPFMLIAGGTDAELGAVSFRFRNGEQRNNVPVDHAVAEIARFVAERKNHSPGPDDVFAVLAEEL